MAKATTTIHLIAKMPHKGLVKTRIAKTLGDEQALCIYEKLLHHTLALCEKLKGQLEVIWHYDGQVLLPWQKRAEKMGIALVKQSEGDLTDRLIHASQQTNSTNHVFIGSDCPALSAAHIMHATHYLETGWDKVLTPAKDGGFVLLGAKIVEEKLFEQVLWSTSQVSIQTAKNVKHLGQNLLVFKALADIDTASDWADYQHLLENQS